MRVGITVIAYNQPQYLLELAKTAVSWAGHEVRLYIFLHSKNKEVAIACDEIEEQHNATVLRYRHNRGVSLSWNDGLIKMVEDGCDVTMIVNDDVWFTEGDIDRIMDASFTYLDCYAIFCAGFHVGFDVPINCHGMSCFAMQPIALERIGFYDENFFPAYNEDVDYSRRAAKAGLKPHIVSDTNVHHVGSAAIQTSKALNQQNYITHGANNEYWKNKWGCPVTEDPNAGFDFPFNNPRFHPYHISKKDRHFPYPPYNRGDREIVKV